MRDYFQEPRAVFYLIYVSSAVNLMNDEELLYLLGQCREGNRELGITGMLLYKEGNLMQMLEGEKPVVLDLYETIKKDPRHKDIITIMMDDSEHRVFDQWSMGFRNMDRFGAMPEFDDYMKENLNLRFFSGNAEKAHRFITFFNEANR